MSALTEFGGRPHVATGEVEIVHEYRDDRLALGIGKDVGVRWFSLPYKQAQQLARKLFGALPPASQPLSPMTVRAITRALSRKDAPNGSDVFANEKALAEFRQLIGGE